MRALAGMIQFCSSFLRDFFRADGSERGIPAPGYQLPPGNLSPPLPYRVLINDTRCSRSRGGSFPLVIIRILSASRLARGRRRRSLNGEIETITALDRS